MSSDSLVLPPLWMDKGPRMKAKALTLPVIDHPFQPFSMESRLKMEARNIPVRPEYVTPPSEPFTSRQIFAMDQVTDQFDFNANSSYTSSPSRTSHQRTASSSTAFTESGSGTSIYHYDTAKCDNFCGDCCGIAPSANFIHSPYPGAGLLTSESLLCSPVGSIGLLAEANYYASASDFDSHEPYEANTALGRVAPRVPLVHGSPFNASPSSARAPNCTMMDNLSMGADTSTHTLSNEAAPIMHSPKSSEYRTGSSDSEYTPHPPRRKPRLAAKPLRHDPYASSRPSRIPTTTSPSKGLSTYQQIVASSLDDDAEDRVKTRARKQWNIKEYDFLDPVVAEWVEEHPGQDVIDMQPLWPKVMVEMEKRLGHARTWNGFLTVACKHYQHQTSRSVRVTKQKDRTEKVTQGSKM